jgi:hypothetical protein
MKPLEVRRETWFQHDGAPAHCTNVVCEYLDETFGNRWSGRGDPMMWPPRSPDLTPLEVHAKPAETPVETQHDLVARIAVATGTIRKTPEIFQTVQYNMVRRCRTCNKVGDRHFEQFLQCKTMITSPKTYASTRKILLPFVQKEAFPDMGVLTKCDHIEPVYLPYSAVTYIYLHPLYAVSSCKYIKVQFVLHTKHITSRIQTTPLNAL